jgi:hypothetical protein
MSDVVVWRPGGKTTDQNNSHREQTSFDPHCSSSIVGRPLLTTPLNQQSLQVTLWPIDNMTSYPRLGTFSSCKNREILWATFRSPSFTSKHSLCFASMPTSVIVLESQYTRTGPLVACDY